MLGSSWFLASHFECFLNNADTLLELLDSRSKLGKWLDNPGYRV